MTVVSRVLVETARLGVRSEISGGLGVTEGIVAPEG